MTRRMVALLSTEMGEAYQTLRLRLEGLTDEEFFWEPVRECWTVRRFQDDHWIEDYADPAPHPPPFTTIAWRLVHVAACKVMYYEYAFGPGRLTWDRLVIPHAAATAIGWLEEGHTKLQTALEGLTDADLDERRATNWGEQWPIWQIFWAMISHDLHHGAEIGCLRDLYGAMSKGESSRSLR